MGLLLRGRWPVLTWLRLRPCNHDHGQRPIQRSTEILGSPSLVEDLALDFHQIPFAAVAHAGCRSQDDAATVSILLVNRSVTNHPEAAIGVNVKELPGHPAIIFRIGHLIQILFLDLEGRCAPGDGSRPRGGRRRGHDEALRLAGHCPLAAGVAGVTGIAAASVAARTAVEKALQPRPQPMEQAQAAARVAWAASIAATTVLMPAKVKPMAAVRTARLGTTRSTRCGQGRRPVVGREHSYRCFPYSSRHPGHRQEPDRIAHILLPSNQAKDEKSSGACMANLRLLQTGPHRRTEFPERQAGSWMSLPSSSPRLPLVFGQVIVAALAGFPPILKSPRYRQSRYLLCSRCLCDDGYPRAELRSL